MCIDLCAWRCAFVVRPARIDDQNASTRWLLYYFDCIANETSIACFYEETGCEPNIYDGWFVQASSSCRMWRMNDARMYLVATTWHCVRCIYGLGCWITALMVKLPHLRYARKPSASLARRWGLDNRDITTAIMVCSWWMDRTNGGWRRESGCEGKKKRVCWRILTNENVTLDLIHTLDQGWREEDVGRLWSDSTNSCVAYGWT